MLECVKRLVSIDREWIPNARGYSLYMRPTLIATTVRDPHVEQQIGSECSCPTLPSRCWVLRRRATRSST
jgi:hypothetical protein